MTKPNNHNPDLLDEDDNDEEQYEKNHFLYDPDQINIATIEPTIEQLLRRINEEALDLASDFQRQANIWKDDVKSRLIESILIRIPLPAFYIDATDEEKWLVVDGLQRLSTLRHFVSDKSDKRLRLCGLEYLTGLEGKTYDKLELRYQRRIKETRVTVYLLEKGTPSEVKYNIFKRINKGSVPLSNQELRHALNPGKGTKFLAKLAASQEFQQVVQLSESRKKRMDDQEFILGFLAFRLTPYQDYQEGNRDSFLNDALFKANKLNEEELIAIEGVFYKAMIAALEIFGDQAFRKIYKTNKRKKPLNKSLFEAWSVNLSYLSDVQIEVLNNNKQKLINLLINYMDTDQEFLASISQAANKVKYRFSTIEKIIQEVLS